MYAHGLAWTGAFGHVSKVPSAPNMLMLFERMSRQVVGLLLAETCLVLGLHRLAVVEFTTPIGPAKHQHRRVSRARGWLSKRSALWPTEFRSLSGSGIRIILK